MEGLQVVVSQEHLYDLLKLLRHALAVLIAIVNIITIMLAPNRQHRSRAFSRRATFGRRPLVVSMQRVCQQRHCGGVRPGSAARRQEGKPEALHQLHGQLPRERVGGGDRRRWQLHGSRPHGGKHGQQLHPQADLEDVRKGRCHACAS